jgi:hypothetical protein
VVLPLPDGFPIQALKSADIPRHGGINPCDQSQLCPYSMPCYDNNPDMPPPTGTDDATASLHIEA